MPRETNASLARRIKSGRIIAILIEARVRVSLINTPTAFQPRFTVATCDELFMPDIMSLRQAAGLINLLNGYCWVHGALTWRATRSRRGYFASKPRPKVSVINSELIRRPLCTRTNRPSKFVHISTLISSRFFVKCRSTNCTFKRACK